MVSCPVLHVNGDHPEVSIIYIYNALISVYDNYVQVCLYQYIASVSIFSQSHFHILVT